MRFVYIITLLLSLVSVPVLSQGAQSQLDKVLSDFSSFTGHTDSLLIRSLDSTVQITNEIYLDDSTASQLLVLKNNIYAASINGIVYCINETGKINWEYHTDGKISSSIIGTGDLVVVMTDAGDLFAINANNGDLVQAIGIGEDVNSNILFTDIEYNDLKTKGVVFGTADGNVYCYELYSLEMVWENNLISADDISGTYLVKDKIIIQTKSENYYCLDSENGVLIWKWKPKTKSVNANFQIDLISIGTSIYNTDSDGNLISVDLLLGTENWTKNKMYATGRIFLINDELILHSSKNKILFIDPKNGKTKNEVNLANDFENSVPTCILEKGKEILIGFSNGYVCELSEKKIIKPILITGFSPVNSLVKKNNSSYISVNRSGKIIEFKIN